MSLFDQQSSFVTLEDAYPGGKPFVLIEGDFEGMYTTSYGPRECARIYCLDPADEPTTEPQQFLVWGSTALQIKDTEPGELPALVKFVKGKPNRIEPAGELSDIQRQAYLKARQMASPVPQPAQGTISADGDIAF